MPSFVVVSRPNAWSGRAVAHKIFIEGRQVGKVRNDSALTLPGPPGTIRVHTRSGGARSQEVTLTLGEGGAAYLVSRPNTVASVVGAVVGAAAGWSAVMFGPGPAVFFAVLLGIMALSLGLGRLAPGLFVKLEVTGVVPSAPPVPGVPGQPWPQQQPWPGQPGVS